MDNEDDELHRPSTSRGDEMSDVKMSECTKESSRLNNNLINGYDGSECCVDCDTAAQQDHMIAASLVHCDQEDNDSDDDCCIYTYRGDRQEPIVSNLPADNRSTSPLMDYLEMDFDPEPTVGNESEDEDIIVPDTANHQNKSLTTLSTETVSIPCCSGVNVIKQEELANNIEVNKQISGSPVNPSSTQNNGFTGFKEERNGCLRRIAPDTMEVCQKMKRMRVEDVSWVKEMVWSENEAAQYQMDQIGESACGATSVVNTLLALRIPFNIDHVVKTIGTRLRNQSAPLIPYLESRSVAGCMAQDLVRTLETVTDSLVSARFFATPPHLDIPIAEWLVSWMKKGAIPILTLNHQQSAVSPSNMPDSWHHQMMYGLAYNPLRSDCAQIYLTNPLEQLSLDILRPQLMSQPTLMIRRADVLSRWTPQTDLMSLATHPNQQWHRFNVLGQIVNLLRESREDVQFTNHITIPAGYASGVTLAIRTSSNHSHELKSVPEL